MLYINYFPEKNREKVVTRSITGIGSHAHHAERYLILKIPFLTHVYLYRQKDFPIGLRGRESAISHRTTGIVKTGTKNRVRYRNLQNMT